VLSSAQEPLDEHAQAFYRGALSALNAAGVEYLVGGAYALARHTGVARHTKDIDIFVRERDLEHVLSVLEMNGCCTEITYPHWLGKARCGEELMDVIYGSGNGVVMVDDEWFEHALPDTILGQDVLLCPAEEMIWSKAFIMERERYDGADVLHLLHAGAHEPEFDWARLVRRFDGHYRVLFAHLILFGFVYPSERALVPRPVMEHLMRRLRVELDSPPPEVRLCQGTLLSRAQFLVDIERFGYEDARNDPDVHMTEAHIAQWTDAIADELRTYGCNARNHTPGRSR
jgi:Nucleotidyl transferase of unknown function (DUF2204)